MLTQTEMQKIVDQINNKFNHLDKRIEDLENQLSQKKTPTSSTTTKKTVDKS